MTINIPCWTTSKEEADKLVDNLSEVCFEYGKDESTPKMLNVFYATKALKNYVGIMQGRIELLNARIAELEEAQRWIPVSERLPEDLQSIIVFTKDRKTYIIRFLELYGREGFGSLSDIVTHWMPMPTLPEVQE